MRIFDFFFQKAISRRISAFQDEMMNRHVAEVENLYRQMRGWRHDYHNHIQMMKPTARWGRMTGWTLIWTSWNRISRALTY